MTIDEKRDVIYAYRVRTAQFSAQVWREIVQSYSRSEIEYHYAAALLDAPKYVAPTNRRNLERQYRLGLLPEQGGRLPKIETVCLNRWECPCPNHLNGLLPDRERGTV